MKSQASKPSGSQLSLLVCRLRMVNACPRIFSIQDGAPDVLAICGTIALPYAHLSAGGKNADLHIQRLLWAIDNPAQEAVMSSIRAAIIQQIEVYCENAGISTDLFCRRALKDHKFLTRLRTGQNVTLHRVEAALAFIGGDDAAFRDLEEMEVREYLD